MTGIHLRIPDTTLLDGVAAFGAHRGLRESVEIAIGLVAGEHVQVSPESELKDAVCDLWVGCKPGAAPPTKRSLVFFGDGWTAFAGASHNAPDIMPSSDSPLGPYFSACMASGEVFKHLRGLQRGEFITSLIFSLWTGEVCTNWNERPDAPSIEGLVLRPFYLVGVGAVGQASVLALVAARTLRGYATLIDHELLDGTNLNRYLLARQMDASRSDRKVKVAAKALRRRGFDAYAYFGRWEEYLKDIGRQPQRSDVATCEADLRYETVLSCVDNDIVRHEIQNCYPRDLLGASTDGLRAAVTDYDMLSPYQCLKCWNDLPPWHANFTSVKYQLRAMSREQRDAWAREHGFDAGALELHLSDPKCGELTERDLARFATATESAFSVSFVSAAAGFMLAAQLLRTALDGASGYPSDQGTSLYFSFLNGRCRWVGEPRSTKCSCMSGGQDRYRHHWSPSVLIP